MRPFPTLVLCTTLVTVLFGAPTGASGQETPRELLDSWVELWGTGNLDLVPALFLRDDRVTYFSSEFEGLIRGYPALVEHHRGFGFEAGGVPREQVIWVGDVEIVDFGDTALVGAIWYFGDPASPEGAQRGPMSVIAVATSAGYRIGHMHFATYAEAEPAGEGQRRRP